MSYQKLFDVINDDSARPDEVDDAIMYLADYANEEVVNYLLDIANKNMEDYMLSSVGESLGQILANDENLYVKYHGEIKKLPDFVQREVDAILKHEEN